MIGNRRTDCGWKGFTTSVLFQASCTVMSDVTFKKGDFNDTKLQQRDCCEELCLRFNVGQLGVDVKLEQTATDFDDIKYGNLRFNRLGREITEREWKNHHQSNTAHIL